MAANEKATAITIENSSADKKAAQDKPNNVWTLENIILTADEHFQPHTRHVVTPCFTHLFIKEIQFATYKGELFSPITIRCTDENSAKNLVKECDFIIWHEEKNYVTLAGDRLSTHNSKSLFDYLEKSGRIQTHTKSASDVRDFLFPLFVQAQKARAPLLTLETLISQTSQMMSTLQEFRLTMLQEFRPMIAALQKENRELRETIDHLSSSNKSNAASASPAPVTFVAPVATTTAPMVATTATAVVSKKLS